MMMNSRFRVAGAVVLLGMAIGAQAQVKQVGGKYQFRIKYTVGKTISYNMRTSMNMGTTAMNIDMPMKVKCTAQKGDVYTVQSTSGPATRDGKPMMQGAKPQTATFQIKSTGEPVGTAPGGVGLNNIKMPTEAIPVGHTWAGTISMPQGGGSAKANYKFVGVKSIGGKQCAQIAITMTMTGGMGNMKGNGTLNLLMDDGQAQNMQMTVGGSLGGGPNGQKMDLKSTISMKRL